MRSSPTRTARFEREAKVLASLNHPHIAALYGMEQSGGRHFLVMELVEGETLADRLRRGALPAEPTVAIAVQIAEALEAAHERGVVHRDLKPANVKITPDDQVKVLDFGLAKALGPPEGPDGQPRGSSAAGLTHSPTLSVMATQAGLILGTAAYMSPEQAKGLQADPRSDVFSFGVVLYEMLTGRQPFLGEAAPEVLASVLIRDADLTTLPADLTPRLRDVLRRCLEKNPKKRWQAVGDLRAELEAIASQPRSISTIAPVVIGRQARGRLALAAALGALVAGVATAGATWMLRPVLHPPIVTRFQIALGEGQRFTNTGRHAVAISPDGTKIVYVANRRLYLRSMWDLEARPIPGTDTVEPVNPVFSPDGMSIAFFSNADSTLKRIGVNGGVALTVCPATNTSGMSWGEDGIVFGQAAVGILRVSASGGKPDVLVPVKDGEVANGAQVLPGNGALLFTLAVGRDADRWDKAQIVAQSPGSSERKVLVEGGSDARYLSTGHLVYAVSGSLFAVPLDVRRLEVVGGPVPVVEGVMRAVGPGRRHRGGPRIDLDNRLISLHPGIDPPFGSGQLHLVFLDRSGGIVPLKLPAGPNEFQRVSPDGTRVAFGVDDGREASVWIYELSGASSMRRLTLTGANRYPLWSPDGQRVAFQSDREGDRGIFWQRSDGTGVTERLTKADQGVEHVPESLAPNGATLLFAAMKGNRRLLWTLSIRDKKVEPFNGMESEESIDATFSPDGRWVAYDSTEANGSHVYVQPFPRSPGTRYQVTKDSARNAFWSPDGNDLFYAPTATEFAAVAVSRQPTFAFGDAIAVPRGGLIGLSPSARRNYDPHPDGKRIIGVADSALSQAGATAPPGIQVVLNWQEELKRLVPVD